MPEAIGASIRVASVADLLALARRMEAQAARRLRLLADAMDGHGNATLAELFRTLAAEEDRHEAAVDDLAGRLGEAPLGEPASAMPAPEALPYEDLAEAGGLRLLTPYKALCLAVQSEERAFAFFVALASADADPAVEAHAEALAKEELRHLALLRLERRRAWRAGFGSRATPPRSPEDLFRVAATLEVASAVAYQALADEMAEDRGGIFVARLAAAAERRSQRLGAGKAPEVEAVPSRVPAALSASRAGTGSPDEALRERRLRSALQLAEGRFELYAAAAENAVDEAVLRLAQALETAAVGDIALLQDQLEARERSVAPS
jgi:rubrerythrin